MKRLSVLLGLVICTVAASTASATMSRHAGSPRLSSQVALDWNSYAVDAVRAAHTLDGVPAGGAPRTLYQPEGLIYMAYVEAAVYDAVTKIEHRDGKAVAVTTTHEGAEERYECDHVISSMPISGFPLVRSRM